MRIRKQFFNLIEIVLAMGVVVVGMTGVLAMLPPALDANRDAAAETLAGEVSSKMSAYLEFLSKSKPWKIGSADNQEGILGISTGNLPSSYTSKKLADISGTDFMGDTTIKQVSLSHYYAVSGDETQAVEIHLQRMQISDIHNVSTNSSTTIGNDYAQRILIEVSWPTTITNKNYRRKLYSVLEVTNPDKVREE